MRSVLQDLRGAWRMAKRSPGFTLVAIVTLALGLGVNTAVFSVFSGVLLDPLPFPSDRQLVWIWPTVFHTGVIRQSGLSPLDFLDYRAQDRSFSSMCAFFPNFATLLSGGEPERVAYTNVSGDFFSTLGVAPLLGRTLELADETPPLPQAAVLSYGLWKGRYGGDEHIVGKTLDVEHQLVSIVGVMPPGFNYPNDSQLWMAESFNNPLVRTRRYHFLSMLGRMKPGVDVADAKADMNAMGLELRRQYPDSNADQGTLVVSLAEQMEGSARPILTMIMVAAVLVLLIGCANVASLLLARSAVRRKEMAVRASLGAGSGRILRQLLTESVAMALMAGAVGVFLALAGMHFLPLLERADVPRLVEARIDFRVLGFTVLLSMLTGILFGLAPAAQLTGGSLSASLKEGALAGQTGGRRHRLQGVLVSGEIAISLMLLIGSGLLIRSLLNLQRVHPGFDVPHRLTFSVSIPAASNDDVLAGIPIFRSMVDRLQHLPGVESVGMVSELPLAGQRSEVRFTIAGRPQVPRDQRPEAGQRHVLADYFQAMEIPLLEGRVFSAADDEKSQPVVVISRTVQQTFFPNQDPVGQYVSLDIGRPFTARIVGVVGAIHHQSLAAEPTREIYIPFAQAPVPDMTVVVRAAGDPVALTAQVRRIVRDVNANIPIYKMRTLDEVAADSLFQERFRTLLLAGMAALALLLAVAGIYSVMSYTVAQRTREVGIRMALGARPGQVRGMVLWHALRLSLLGVVIGLAGAATLAALLSSFLSSVLFRVARFDPITYAALPAVLVVIAVAAAYWPATCATRVNPTEALRCE